MATNGSSSNDPAPPVSAATTLRRRLNDPSAPILVCPGVYDGLSARIALNVGFEALYMTGAGTSASLLGQPDLGLLSFTEMRQHADALASLSPRTPLVADADTGFGGPLNITRTVQAYARSGVAGLHIEDQVQTKRCGHLSGKQLVGRAEFVARIRAAVAARRAVGSDILVIARTDALQVGGWEEAVARLRAARAEGADAGFLEGVASKDEARGAVVAFPGWPMVLNMVYGGLTPAIGVKEAAEMGFRAVIFPFAGVGPACRAIERSMRELWETGELAEGGDGRMGPREVFEVVGLEECVRIDRGVEQGERVVG